MNVRPMHDYLANTRCFSTCVLLVVQRTRMDGGRYDNRHKIKGFFFLKAGAWNSETLSVWGNQISGRCPIN